MTHSIIKIINQDHKVAKLAAIAIALSLIPLNKNKKKRLNIEPLRLRKNVGPRKVPTMILTINTRIIETQTAVTKSNLIIVKRIIILAIPGLTPGINDPFLFNSSAIIILRQNLKLLGVKLNHQMRFGFARF